MACAPIQLAERPGDDHEVGERRRTEKLERGNCIASANSSDWCT